MDPKVKAAGAGSGAAGALAVVVVWALTLAHVDVPAEVGAAFATIFSGVGALAGGYLKPRS
jgi:hypothetical protein